MPLVVASMGVEQIPGTVGPSLRQAMYGEARLANWEEPGLQKLLFRHLEKCAGLRGQAWSTPGRTFLIDTMILHDPAHDKNLRSHKGFHPATVRAVLRSMHFDRIKRRIQDSIRELQQMSDETRSTCTILLVCKSGRHRSVCLARAVGALSVEYLQWPTEEAHLSDHRWRWLCADTCRHCNAPNDDRDLAFRELIDNIWNSIVILAPEQQPEEPREAERPRAVRPRPSRAPEREERPEDQMQAERADPARRSRGRRGAHGLRLRPRDAVQPIYIQDEEDDRDEQPIDRDDRPRPSRAPLRQARRREAQAVRQRSRSPIEGRQRDEEPVENLDEQGEAEATERDSDADEGQRRSHSRHRQFREVAVRPRSRRRERRRQQASIPRSRSRARPRPSQAPHRPHEERRADPDPDEDDEAARDLLQEMVGNMTTLPRNRLVLVNRASAEVMHGGSGQGALRRFYEAGPADLQGVTVKLVQLNLKGDAVALLQSRDGMLRGDALRFFKSIDGLMRERTWPLRVLTRSAFQLSVTSMLQRREILG